MSGVMKSNIKNSLFYQLVNLFDNISEVEDEYYRNIEKEKLFQLISFVIFRDDVFEVVNELLSSHKKIISKRMDYIFCGNVGYKKEVEKFDRMKKRLFELSGYKFIEVDNSIFNLYYLFEYNGNSFKVVYKPVKVFLDWRELQTIEAMNYSNIPFSYKNKKIKIVMTYTTLPDKINKKLIELTKQVGSNKEKYLSLKDVNCIDLKKKLTMLYLFMQNKQSNSRMKKKEQVNLLIIKLKELNREIKKDLIRKCKMLSKKFDKSSVYQEAMKIYKELSYPLNEKYIWNELNKYQEVIEFYNGSKK
jgi:hypothetical protein